MPENALVLVVEDNDFVRTQIVSYLKAEGFSAIEAMDGDEALEVMESGEAIDLAIVDVNMEPVGGFEFIQSIQGSRLECPVILVTGDETPDLLERAGACGVGAVLMKPVQKDRLVKTVTKVIQAGRKIS